tara:strand:+ start:3063 stop:3770 length:708 start_codon:yes stop_codon:yes gene_type:complete
MTTATMSYQDFAAASAYVSAGGHERPSAPSPSDHDRHIYTTPCHDAIEALGSRISLAKALGSNAEMVVNVTFDELATEYWADLGSTLLINSGMKGLAQRSLSTAATFASTYINRPKQNLSVLRAFEELGSCAELYNPHEIQRFLAKNIDILDLLHNAIKATHLHADIIQLKAWIFNDPEDGSQSLYISAVVQGDDFEKAYEIENTVFETALEQNSRLNNFRILLSFETEEDGRSE